MKTFLRKFPAIIAGSLLVFATACSDPLGPNVGDQGDRDHPNEPAAIGPNVPSFTDGGAGDDPGERNPKKDDGVA